MQNLKVIFEDNHIIVVEKPVNIPSQADKTGDIDMLTIIKAYLKEKYNKPGNVYLGLVHRLDRPVGGVMVFAKTSKAASRLSEQIRNKSIEKRYIALTHNHTKEHEILKDKLLKNEKTNTSKIDEKGNKFIFVYGVVWFTNIDHARRHDSIILWKKYNEEEFPKYDNYDAIEVSKVTNIPKDYDGIMGVPITFLHKYNPSQFEIVWTSDRGGDGRLENLKVKNAIRFDAPVVNGKGLYKRIFIKRK